MLCDKSCTFADRPKQSKSIRRIVDVHSYNGFFLRFVQLRYYF